MIPLLLGLKESVATQKSIQLLSDSGIRYKYEDILNTQSRLSEMMIALTGSSEVPQLFVGGESYVGKGQIQRYIGH